MQGCTGGKARVQVQKMNIHITIWNVRETLLKEIQFTVENIINIVRLLCKILFG